MTKDERPAWARAMAAAAREIVTDEAMAASFAKAQAATLPLIQSVFVGTAAIAAVAEGVKAVRASLKGARTRKGER